MRFLFKPSFNKTFKKLEPNRRSFIIKALEQLKELFESGIKTEGLGLKHLTKDIWEIRASIRERILFSIEKDTAIFMLAGNHDEIVKFLKNR